MTVRELKKDFEGSFLDLNLSDSKEKQYEWFLRNLLNNIDVDCSPSTFSKTINRNKCSGTDYQKQYTNWLQNKVLEF